MDDDFRDLLHQLELSRQRGQARRGEDPRDAAATQQALTSSRASMTKAREIPQYAAASEAERRHAASPRLSAQRVTLRQKRAQYHKEPRSARVWNW